MKTAAEYNAASERVVTLPSGLEVKITVVDAAAVLTRFDMQPSAVILYRQYRAQRIDPDEEVDNTKRSADKQLTPEQIERIESAKQAVNAAAARDGYALACAFICASAIEPQFKLQPGDQPEDAICVQRLNQRDRETLSEAIFTLSGMRAEEVAAAAPFPDPADGAGAEPPMEGQPDQHPA